MTMNMKKAQKTTPMNNSCSLLRRLALYSGTLAALAVSGTPGNAAACDPCALYSLSRLEAPHQGKVSLSVSEQYTDYSETSQAKNQPLKDGEIARGFSTTQFALSYDIDDLFSVQTTLPLIIRTYDKVQGYRRDREEETGLGDASLIGSLALLNERTASGSVRGALYSGVKFPTGDTGALEELTEDDAEGRNLGVRHHTASSGSGTRALTLGSGSYDVIFGGAVLAKYDRFLVGANTQYTLRTEGDFNYEFADDLLWSIGPGYYLLLEHEQSLAARITLSGEHKASDTLDGTLQSGTKYSHLFVGPELLFTLPGNLSGETGIDFRVYEDDPGTTVLPDYRLRAALSYRFN